MYIGVPLKGCRCFFQKCRGPFQGMKKGPLKRDVYEGPFKVKVGVPSKGPSLKGYVGYRGLFKNRRGFFGRAS